MLGIQPSDYGLPHPTWRPRQYETVVEALSMEGGKTMLLEAPTGSGKTAIARAVGHEHSVTALCKTKVLQQENYADGYGFAALFGRGNYQCALEPLLTGSECEYAEQGMHECPEVEECPYLRQKQVVMGSPLRALNYAYWLTARWPRVAATDYVVCDEAHLLSDTILNFTGATILEHQRIQWDLPPFPVLHSNSGSVLIKTSPTDEALSWLKRARSELLRAHADLNRRKHNNPAVLKKLRSCERLGLKIRATIDALQANAKDWYIVSGPRARKVGYMHQPGFVCKPLTARYHAPRFFLDGWNTILMSATIGNQEAFAAELGLPPYSAVSVPSAWAPETRPVIIPKDAPRLGRAAKAKGAAPYDLQAKLIADLIKSAPSTWCGVIHHTSIQGAKTLAQRLGKHDLAGRMWLPPERIGTEAQMEQWAIHKQKVPNAIAVTWFWHAGVDLLDEQICIVAKVPFPYLADKYERARLDYDPKFYLQRTAWTLEQACGRTRRGRPQDYDTEDEQRGLVAIVDGNWTRCQKYLSQPFLDSLVKV
jgi:Rad3-related DNA helicase